MQKTYTLLAAALGLALCAGLFGSFGVAPASADEAAPATELDGAMLYKTKTCLACHGVDANTPLLPIYPKLAGQNAEYALAQMKDIKSGARSNGQTLAMKGIMHLVSDAEMEALATYLASLDD